MSWVELDLAFYLLRPLMNLVLLFTVLLRCGIALLAPDNPLNRAFLISPAAATLLLTFFLFMQIHALYREGYRRAIRWIPLSFVFALTWYLPVLRGLVKRKERRWVSTGHTRSLSIGEVRDDTAVDRVLERLHGIDNLHRMTLGRMLVKSAVISNEQLQEALERQHETGGQLGEIIVNMQVISKETLDVYLSLQQSLRKKAGEEGLPGHRLRLGELLLDAKVISQEQLEEAFAHQRATGCLLGESLVSIRAMSRDTLTTFLNIQHVLDDKYLAPQRALHLINGIMRESVNTLGMLLFASGLISRYQLDVALAYQKEHGGVLGEVIVKLGFASQEHINALLEIQRASRADQARRAKGGGRVL